MTLWPIRGTQELGRRLLSSSQPEVVPLYFTPSLTAEVLEASTNPVVLSSNLVDVSDVTDIRSESWGGENMATEWEERVSRRTGRTYWCCSVRLNCCVRVLRGFSLFSVRLLKGFVRTQVQPALWCQLMDSAR